MQESGWVEFSVPLTAFDCTKGATITFHIQRKPSGGSFINHYVGSISIAAQPSHSLSGAATCTQPSVCTVCGAVAEAAKGHNYRYGIQAGTTNVMEQTCSRCDLKETATLTAKDATYSGREIKTGTITYSNNWAGDRPADSAITYANNINGGTATARLQLHGKTLSTQYTIRPLRLMGPGGASISPSSGTYTGQRHTPNITVYNPSYPNVTAKDYTMDVTWSPAEPINAGSYTARVVISGNYSGYWDVKYTINKANLTNVQVNVTPTSTACGMPIVTASASSVGNQPVTFTYSTSENGTYTTTLPTFSSPGTHTVYYKASAPNHNDAVGSFQDESVSTPVTNTGSSMRIPYVGGQWYWDRMTVV